MFIIDTIKNPSGEKELLEDLKGKLNDSEYSRIQLQERCAKLEKVFGTLGRKVNGLNSLNTPMESASNYYSASGSISLPIHLCSSEDRIEGKSSNNNKKKNCAGRKIGNGDQKFNFDDGNDLSSSSSLESEDDSSSSVTEPTRDDPPSFTVKSRHFSSNFDNFPDFSHLPPSSHSNMNPSMGPITEL